MRNNPTTLTDPSGLCDVDKEHHNWLWCAAHSVGLVETLHEQAQDARNFFTQAQVTQNGKVVDPSKLSDQQVVRAFQQFNAEWRTLVAEGANPYAVMSAPGLFPDAGQIASGHAWIKHQGEFPGWTQKDFEQKVEETIQNAKGADVKQLSNGRTAYWNDTEKMVVIHDPHSPDGGTAFRPVDGRAYFDNELR